MSGARILPLLLLIGLFVPVGRVAAQTPLTLDACVQLALGASSPVTLARLDANIAERGRVAARAGFFPQAYLGVDYLYNSPSPANPVLPSFIPSDAIREFRTLLTLVEDLDTSGRVRAGHQRAQAEAALADTNVGIAERDLRQSVSTAYYQLLLARKLIEVFEQQVDEAVAFENRTLTLSEAGEAARADVVKATAQTASFRQALSAARTAAELANQELASFWTEDVAEPLELVDALEQPVPEPVPTGNDRPYLTRPEYRLFDAQQLGFEADARLARAANRPQVQLAFQWGVDQPTPGWSFDNRGYALVANLQFQLFDWSRASSQAQQAEARAAQIGITRDAANREFAREYQSALARVRGSFESISLSRIQVTAAEEDLRLSRVRYDGGEGQALEVVTAQTQLANAQSAYYSAIAGYLTAQVDLEVASGR